MYVLSEIRKPIQYTKEEEKMKFWKNTTEILETQSSLSQCGGFNENGPQRLIYLNVWLPVGGTVCEGWCHGWMGMGVSKAYAIPS